MTFYVREPPVVSVTPDLLPLHQVQRPASDNYATCRSPSQPREPSDVLACAANAARKVVGRGSVPRHLLLTRANQARVLPCVNTAYAAVAQVIRHAEHEVLMQNYVWEDRTRGAQCVMQAVRDRCADVARGVRPAWQLRIVVHHRGRYALPTASKFKSLELEGFIRSLNPSHVHAELAYAHNHAIGADILHSKNVIVDGREVLFLGTNFDKHNDPPDSWYDNGLHLTGPPAQSARADWCHVRTCRQTRLRSANMRLPPPKALPGPGQEGSLAPVLVVSHLARRWPLSSASCEANPQDQSVLALLKSAQRSIAIITPCLNVPSVRQAIIDAVLRGVVVHYVTCLNMDSRLQRWFRGGNNADNARMILREVIKRGGPEAAKRVHIAWSSFDGVTIPQRKTHGTSHAKNMCIDDHVLMMGSMNLDWQSWNNSRELSCIIDDARVAAQWRAEVFDKRWRAAVPMMAQDLPWWHRHRFGRAYRYLKK